MSERGEEQGLMVAGKELFEVSLDMVFLHSLSLCRAHGRRPGLHVFFWVVSVKMGWTAADRQSLQSWKADNRELLR